MKNITKIFIIGGVVTFLLLFGVSQYKYIKVKASSIYTTIHKRSAGIMTMGGMSHDKDKISAFKKDFEKDDYVNKYWDYLHRADFYADKGDYENAIIQSKKALEVVLVAGKAGDIWQVRAGLARFYEKAGQYDFALKEYGWMRSFQGQILKEALAKNDKIAINNRTKIIQDISDACKRIEELKQSAK